MSKKFLDVNKDIINAIFALDDVEDIDTSVKYIIDEYGIEKAEKKKPKKKEEKKKSKKEDSKVTPLRKIIVKRLK